MSRNIPYLAAPAGHPRHKAVFANAGAGLLVLGSIFLLTGCGSHAASEGAKAEAAAPAKPDAAAPGTFKVTREQAATLKIVEVGKQGFSTEQVTDGKIALNANRLTPVFSPYSGRVVKVLASLGDTVKAGTPLLAVEASEVVQTGNDLLTASAGLATAKAQLALAEKTEARKHALYDAKGGALQDWQQSQSDLVVAQGAERTAETTLALARNRLRILGKSDDEIAATEAHQKVDALAYVVAPITGVVTDRQVGPGQYVQAAASNPVYTIGDVSSVWVVANVRETEAEALRKHQTVQVRLPSMPGKVLSGKIDYIAAAMDPNTHRLPVRAEIANPGGVLKPEMFASFTITTSAPSDAVAVPESAVVFEGEKARVWASISPDTLALRQIKVGRTTRGMVEVLDGLKAGDRIVTSGSLFIDRAASAVD